AELGPVLQRLGVNPDISQCLHLHDLVSVPVLVRNRYVARDGKNLASRLSNAPSRMLCRSLLARAAAAFTIWTLTGRLPLGVKSIDSRAVRTARPVAGRVSRGWTWSRGARRRRNAAIGATGCRTRSGSPAGACGLIRGAADSKRRSWPPSVQRWRRER